MAKRGARGGKGGAKARRVSEAKKKTGAAPRGPEMEVVSEKLGEPVVKHFLDPEAAPAAAGAGAVSSEGAGGAEVVDIASRPRADTSGEAGGAASEFHQELECALTDEETARKSAEMASAITRHHQMEDERREYANRTRAEMKALTGLAEELAVQVGTRRELRPVKCRRVLDPEHFKVAIFRVDTGECISVRDMEQGEAERVRQQQARALGPDVVAAILAWRPAAKEAVEATVGGGAAKVARDLAPPVSDFSLRDIPGVGEKAVTALAEHGFGTIQSLRDAVQSDLTKVPGIGKGLANAILLYVGTNFPAFKAPQPAAAEEEVAGEEEEPESPGGDDDARDAMEPEVPSGALREEDESQEREEKPWL